VPEKPSYFRYLFEKLSGRLTVKNLADVCYAHTECPIACQLNDQHIIGRGASGYEAYCNAIIFLYSR
jgi:hypothetical protein